MSERYQQGETKVRPNIYKRQENVSGAAVAGAVDGIGAITIKADWGPLNKVCTFTGRSAESDILSAYGTGGTVDAAIAMFRGGLSTINVIRLGIGGAKATVTLKSGAADCIVLTAKYEGKRSFSVSVRNKLSEDNVKEFIVYEGTAELEKISFPAGDDESAVLAEAINAKSSIFDARTEASPSVVDIVSQTPVSGGESPTVTNSDYAAAFSRLESYKYKGIALDTLETSIQDMLCAYLKNAKVKGRERIGIIGASTDVDFSVRVSNAKSKNDWCIVYFGSSYIDSEGNEIKGINAVAAAAGMITAAASNKSIVHTVIPGAAAIGERLEDDQYVEAINNGLLLLSEGPNGEVWFDSGINTLTTLAEDEDEGWKKIKRVKVRIEAMDRIDRQLAPLIGNVSGNSDGIGIVIQEGSKVLSAMESENKIFSGAKFYLDPELGYAADSAWFIIEFDDVDTLEKIYLNYYFRYKAE